MEFDDELKRIVRLNPLAMFAKLKSENPGNKVYEQCYDNELKEAVDSVCEKMGLGQIVLLRGLLCSIMFDVSNSNIFDGMDEEQLEELKEVVMFSKIADEVLQKAVEKKAEEMQEDDDEEDEQEER